MNKKESSLKLGILLLVITAFAGLILGCAYTVTKEPIAVQADKTNKEAMQELLTNSDTFKKKDVKLTENIVEVNEALKNGKTVGYAMKLNTKGYGGNIELMVGISTDGKVQGIKVLSQSETPGLGANSQKPAFYGQYKGKSIEKELQVTKASSAKDNEIQAITGATITSKAITRGVNDAVNFYKNNLKGGNN
ncbi:RnfABCDGE type electron transport complex subunit G [Clostridium sp. KNHs214]|uniref:RnfABCDGE type electron transport complex subunit G n=1 Tax=Clostridium sp. KNHs214 TaxID=1540257 RepID=UPI00054D035F|nr:RnfABCDGE type electron transport complex subunit G [Clostridium sp. KNHs214]